MAKGICQNPDCGKEFEKHRITTKYCSNNCAQRMYRLANRGSKLITLQCEAPGCANTFTRNPSGVFAHNFCSRACQIAWRQASQKSSTCARCREEFKPHYTKPDQKYCSSACSDAAFREKAEAAKLRQQECMALPGDRDLAAETLAQVPYSSLWRGKGMLPTYSPLLNSDVYVGY